MDQVTTAIIYKALDEILPNPWQTREREDPEHIKNLAMSIGERGLMQVPVARIVKDNGHVQLAFGHSRLAAFKFLRDTGNKGFDTMPVSLQELDDLGMFQSAVAENVDRKDLTPVEEAKAMKVYMDQFGKSSAETGSLFHLAESTVRNKVRLLNLPAEIQEGFASGHMNEGAARELLALFDLPESLRQRAENYWDDTHKPSCIVRAALKGDSGESIAERVSGIVRQYATDMSEAEWKQDREFAWVEAVIGPCKGCAFKMVREKKGYCLQKACFVAKQTAWRREYLQKAALLTGYPVLDDGVTQNTTFGYSDEKYLDVARAALCSNLRVAYDQSISSWENGKIDGFAHAKIVCTKRIGFCTCINASKAHVAMPTQIGKTLVEVLEGEEAVSAETPAPAPLTEDQLKEIARTVRAKKRSDLEEVRAMMEDAGKIIAKGLREQNPALLKRILAKWGWVKDLDLPKDWYEHPQHWWDEIIRAIGSKMAAEIYSTESYQPTPEDALRCFNKVFTEARLPLFSPDMLEEEAVSAETPKTEVNCMTERVQI
jgi:ParB/RepB/Spo0J family partition protein